jgi:hypothetical protein
MMHHRPSWPDEPPWLQEMRDIDASIRRQVDRYVWYVTRMSIALPIACGLVTGLTSAVLLWAK